MKYRVVMHNEQVVDAADEEAARSVGVRGPYRVSVVPLDLEALAELRTKMLKRWGEAQREAKDLDAQIHAVESEMQELYRKGE